MQLHRREGNGSPLSCYHKLLRPLVLIALLGVSRESWEKGLELFRRHVFSLCPPGESIYQLPMSCVSILILNDFPQVEDLNDFGF